MNNRRMSTLSLKLSLNLFIALKSYVRDYIRTVSNS